MARAACDGADRENTVRAWANFAAIFGGSHLPGARTAMAMALALRAGAALAPAVKGAPAASAGAFFLPRELAAIPHTVGAATVERPDIGSVLPLKRIGGIPYVSLTDVARRLRLTVELVPGKPLVLLKDGPRPVVRLASGSREINCEGLRIFFGDPVVIHGGLYQVSEIDYERCLMPLLRPTLLPAPGPRPRLIALDAGHGGKDLGNVNARLNLNEKTFTLDTVRRLEKLLEERGFRVMLTRKDDRFIDVDERPMIAQKAGAELFISVHFNAVPGQQDRVAGAEVFRFTPQYQPPIMYPKPKDGSPHPGNRYDIWNAILGADIFRTVLRATGEQDRGLKHENLGVLRLAQCPAVLVEGGFLSNDTEARRIATPQFRQQLAVGIADGISAYVAETDSLRPAAGAPSGQAAQAGPRPPGAAPQQAAPPPSATPAPPARAVPSRPGAAST